MRHNNILPIGTLSTSAKIKRSINLSIDAAMIIATLSLMIVYLTKGDPKHRLMSCIGTFVYILLPYAVELCRGRRFSFNQHVFFSLYIFVSAFLGSVLNLHTQFAPMDEITHLMFGYCACILFFYFFINHPSYDKFSPLMITFIIFVMSMGTSAIWEVMEFSVDLIGNENSLGYPPQAIMDYIAANNITGLDAAWMKLKYVGVLDTVTDLTLHVIGSLVFSIQYFLHRKLHCNLLLDSMRNEVIKDEMNKSKGSAISEPINGNSNAVTTPYANSDLNNTDTTAESNYTAINAAADDNNYYDKFNNDLTNIDK